MVASLELTQQGRAFLEAGNADDALRVLERAVSIDPHNGENYYYLAEAWMLKDDGRQAAECNKLAAIYLQGNPEWNARVAEQRERIVRTE